MKITESSGAESNVTGEFSKGVKRTERFNGFYGIGNWGVVLIKIPYKPSRLIGKTSVDIGRRWIIIEV